jgi:uncharacterized protein
MSRPGRALTLVLVALALFAAESRAQGSSPPPPPARHLNDYAALLPEAEAQRLDEKLQRFQDETSNDVVVAIFPELPGDALEDFTVRTAQAWRTGRKGLDNGVVLFVFPKDHKLRLEVGYGLEGALPDAIAKRIIEERIAPRFRAGDFPGGLEAGIDAVFQATRGEFEPSPRPERGPAVSPVVLLVAILAVMLLLVWLEGQAGPTVYSRGGWRTYRRGRWGGGWGGGGIGWGGGFGGSGGGGGGGGYSGGGGGQFGGGGASGSW